jgi:hypothetical protein
MKPRILITGGPVHGFIDDVKIVTNKFKGGRMAALAEKFIEYGYRVTYIASPEAKVPKASFDTAPLILRHQGFDDYMELVCKHAPGKNAVILGAAVCNLLPKNRIHGKFPSHNYQPGDEVDITFQICPRVINEVKKVAPDTQLFGFKLLSGVDIEELTRAAYEIVLDSKATAVFANDAKDLDQKYIITKERSCIPCHSDGIADFVNQRLQDEYYQTIVVPYPDPNPLTLAEAQSFIQRHESRFQPNEAGYVFGSVAVKNEDGSFVTTVRGKKDLKEWTTVLEVDHIKRIVVVGNKKATLNAPLLDQIFKQQPDCHLISHFHETNDNDFAKLPWAPPGTVKDSQRHVKNLKQFEVLWHGTYESHGSFT